MTGWAVLADRKTGVEVLNMFTTQRDAQEFLDLLVMHGVLTPLSIDQVRGCVWCGGGPINDDEDFDSPVCAHKWWVEEHGEKWAAS